MPGLYFDEFVVAQMVDYPLRRTITETDNVRMLKMTHNTAPPNCSGIRRKPGCGSYQGGWQDG